MEIKSYDLSTKEGIDRLCKDAARACFGIATSQNDFAMSVVIQELVLPDNKDDFSMEEIAECIKTKLYLSIAVKAMLGGMEHTDGTV